MKNPETLLILGGLLNLLIGLASGIPIGIIRQKEASYSKYLRLVHVGALMWSPILFGLVLVIPLSALSNSVEWTLALMMVVASLLLDLKDIINWRKDVKDEFAEKSQLPLALGGLSSLLSLVSVVGFIWGVILGL